MTSHISASHIDTRNVHEIIKVSDFALKQTLTSDEQLRLLKLFGSFATRQELLMNARTKSKIRY